MNCERLVFLERELKLCIEEQNTIKDDKPYYEWLERRIVGLMKNIEEEKAKQVWELRRYHRKP